MLTFDTENINMVFDITDSGQLVLYHCGADKYQGNIPAKKIYYPAVEIHISGKNQNDHHGAKQTMTSGSTSLKYQKHEFYDNEHGKKLEFVLKDDDISVVLHYQLYNNIRVVRSWCEITNISKENVGLEYVSSFAITGIVNNSEKVSVMIPHNSWVRENNWKKYTLSEAGIDKITPFSTKRINISNTGTWSAKDYLPMGYVENSETNQGMLWQIENNGSWTWEIGDLNDEIYLRLSGPDERDNHWYKELKPNESFTSVKAAIAFGCDLCGSNEELTKYRREITRKHLIDSKLPVIFNDYMNCLWADPTTEKMLPVIDKAAEAGAEYYCMDAGWYADGTWWETVGEWQPCEWRFKNGIKEVFNYIKSKGMIPGIWLEIEVMGINCPILNQFEDECFFMRHGKKVIDHGRYQLDFRNEKVRAFAEGVIDRVVNEYGVGYIKMDYNIDGGIGTEVNSDSFGDGLLEHNRAYIDWLLHIMNKYPSLVIENCSSGGMRMDYAQLSVSPIQSVTDQEDYRNMTPISALAPLAVLPEQAAIWSYPRACDDANAVAYNMINAMMMRIHLSGQITEMSDEKLELIKQGVSVYKSIRNCIPKSYVFYPNGLPDYNDEWIVCGFKGERTFLCVWRRNIEHESVLIDIKCDSAEIIYPQNDNSCLSVNNKLEVTLRSKYSAVIIEIQ